MNLNFIIFLIDRTLLVFKHLSYQQKFIKIKFQTNNLYDNNIICVVYTQPFNKHVLYGKYNVFEIFFLLQKVNNINEEGGNKYLRFNLFINVYRVIDVIIN